MTSDTSDLADVIERAFRAEGGALFWPLLASLERLDAEVERLPGRRRIAVQSRLEAARLAILFDVREIAEGLADFVERQAAVEAICVGARCDV